MSLVLWILVLDSLVVIPFAYLRVRDNAVKYTIIKIFNVVVNVSLNIFFLVIVKNYYTQIAVLEFFYLDNFEINYIFISLLISSALTFLAMSSFYLRIKYKIDYLYWFYVFGTLSIIAFAICYWYISNASLIDPRNKQCLPS